MTQAQADYIERAIADNPGWTVRSHPSAKGTCIVEVGHNEGRWRVEGIARINAAGQVIDWAQA
jgi:hypothetical protein